MGLLSSIRMTVRSVFFEVSVVVLGFFICLAGTVGVTKKFEPDLSTILQSCCTYGKQLANPTNPFGACSDFEVPIPNVPMESQEPCALTVETCCSQTRVDEMCALGAAAGKGDCSVPMTDSAGNATAFSCEDISVFRKCCLACKLGSMTRMRLSLSGAALNSECRSIASSTVNCDQTDAFLQCCLYDFDRQGQPIKSNPKNS